MIFITGDTHGGINIKKLSNKNFNYNILARNDYIIIAGDFGFVWNNSKEQEWWLKWLSEKPCTFLFIDGNHENFDILNSCAVKKWNGGNVHFIKDNVIHLMRGQVFTIDNKKIFTFGGATSIDKENRQEHISWWKKEMPTNEEFQEGLENLDKHNWEVDYVISHCCSGDTLKTMRDYGILKYDYGIDTLNKYFDEIENKLNYKHWYFGHYHEDIKEIVPKQTIVYNNVLKI